MEQVLPQKKLLYIINVDWYFTLHWLDRAKASRDNGYEVHIATRFTGDAHRQSLAQEGFILHDVPFDRRSLKPLKELSSLLALKRTINEVQPHLLHCITLKAVIQGGLANRINLIPCAFSLPGLGIMFGSGQFFKGLTWKFIELLLRLSLGQKKSITLFENQHDRTILSSHGVVKQDQTRVLPGAGVDLDHFTSTPEPGTETIHILFAARLLRSKGLPELVTTVGNLQGQGHKVCLDVAGLIDSDSMDAITPQEIEQWGKLDYVNWLGALPDVVDAIHRSHIVCLPTSYGEGIPRILIEAAACGRPVITTDVPGCNEFVQHEIDGLLVQAGDLEELAKAIIQLAEHSDLRATLGAAGREKVIHNYTNQQVITRTLKIYQKLLDH